MTAGCLFLGCLPGLPADGPLETGDVPSDSGEDESAPLVLLEGSLSAGEYHTCGLTPDKEVVCWGRNDNLQLDSVGVELTSVSAGATHTCGIDTTEEIVCWGGYDPSENTGDTGEAEGSYGSYVFPDDRSYRQVDTGIAHTCAIGQDSLLSCWGEGGDSFDDDAPTGELWRLSTSGYHACAINTEGYAVCWGYNSDNQLQVPADLGVVTAIGAGKYHSCALDSEGQVDCWGSTDDDQTLSPAGEFSQLSVGYFHSCALDTEGSMECWGYNDDGQANALAGQYRAVAAGRDHTCALDMANQVVCWGSDRYGQLSLPLGD